MKFFNKYIIGSFILLLSIFSCEEDMLINNGDSMQDVRETLNAIHTAAVDTAEAFRAIFQSMDYIGTQDSIGDHRTAINSLIAGNIALDLRIDALEAIDHTHPNSSVLNATTAPFTTLLNTTISNHTDSIAKHTDTLQLHNTRIKALENGSGGTGTGDVRVNGTTTNHYAAYWNGTDSTLVSNDVVKFYADSAIMTEYTICYDTLFAKYLAGGSSLYPWVTINIKTGSFDTLNTEEVVAYIGWEMKLPTLKEYENDTRIVNGHIEHKVWYIDSETKELKSQYGWAGLDMLETLTAFSIYHEISMRYLIEHEDLISKQNNKINILFIFNISLFIGIMIYILKKK